MLKCQKDAAWYPCMTDAATDTLRKEKKLPGFVDCFLLPPPLSIWDSSPSDGDAHSQDR